ncbi:ABC transporter permease subunit [Frondihabitans australicus]|uniref:ABC-2 type transport system permease protein n=1 Tax=Frondihabitans australicus TaxID=386892 RepID=A0A495IJE0_9MICO|nr:ABC transporter permease subunit [Frondihabitans australicus]RKR75236.1 ABC-2 type transport system permease protein [Frondihabitans australicus]
MIGVLWAQELRRGLRGLVLWCVVIAAPAFLYLPIYSSFGGSSQIQSLLKSLPPALIKAINYTSISTGAGYTESTYFGLLGFALSAVAAITWGAGLIAREEESGWLELVAAHDVSRLSLGVARALVLVTRIAALAVVAYVVVLAFTGPAGLGIDGGRLVLTAALFGLLALASGAAAFAAGCVTGRSGVALAAGAIVAAGGYALNGIGNDSSGVAWVYRFSPYHWAYGGEPLATGAVGMGAWGLALFAVVLLAIGVVRLLRRDLGR